MKEDPAIQHIRKTRHDISARSGHDPHVLVAYYQAKEADYRDRLLKESSVSYSAK